ncbi:uncharacterized protein [Panulirus ornatus]|uniref:uncharacterized protein n=1 Tax=Panulirus ornatus TaxID=150431 RepID=UPI003A859269
MPRGSVGASCWKGDCHLLDSVNMGLNNDVSQQSVSMRRHQMLLSHHFPFQAVFDRHEHCLDEDEQQTPSTSTSRTNWTFPLSPSSGDIKSDLFDDQISSKRSCRELTHQVPI